MQQFFKQRAGENNCGPLAIMNALCFAGESVIRNGKIYKKILKWLNYNPITGTYVDGTLYGLRAVGFTARYKQDLSIKQLEKELFKGNFLIIIYPLFFLNKYSWHSGLIIGQTEKSFLTVNDGLIRKHNVKYLSKKYYKRHFSKSFTGGYLPQVLIVSRYTPKFSKRMMYTK